MSTAIQKLKERHHAYAPVRVRPFPVSTPEMFVDTSRSKMQVIYVEEVVMPTENETLRLVANLSFPFRMSAGGEYVPVASLFPGLIPRGARTPTGDVR